MSDSWIREGKSRSGIRNELPASELHGLLSTLASKVLQSTIDPEQSLVAQGLDSLTAEELLEAIRKQGYDLDYSQLLDEANINLLVSSLRPKNMDEPFLSAAELSTTLIPLTGPQIIWAKLEQQGWGSWGNISLCVSMPASRIPSAFLPTIAQSLCDANDAMRMRLLPSESDNSVILQQMIPDFQIAVQMREAPRLEKDAMRLIEAFEGVDSSPFEASTRALILSADRNDGRHWICISMHHIFVDRVGIQSLTRQLRAMISKNELRISEKPSIGYADYAVWQNRILDVAEKQQSETTLRTLLAGADISSHRPNPKLANEEELDIGMLPSFSTLSPAQGDALESIATQLETTLPLLLHALFSVLTTRLTGDEQAMTGNADMLLCHVVMNREKHASLRNMVGCLDTSVPVALRLREGETLRSLCVRTRQVFAETHRCASSFPRGEWFGQNADDSEEDRQNSFFERVAHINIIRTPAVEGNEEADADIRIHPVQRVQKTRWGLLLRVRLPPVARTGMDKHASESPDAPGISLSAFAEHRPLAIVAHYCFVELLRDVLGESPKPVGDLKIVERVERIISRVAFASAQLQRTSLPVSPDSSGEAFIWDRLVERQQRWYEHDEHRELVRDKLNRFISTAANPFPFTQLDKLNERRFLDSLDVPQPKLLHVLPRENLLDSFMELAPSLPSSFAIKPVGAGHSFGIRLIRNGIDLTRNGTPLDAKNIAVELTAMADRGYCIHQDHIFRFNFSSFLIEELVVDERGADTPTDYKVFMAGTQLLWIQLHFKENGHTWVAFVDVNFELYPQPAWDPATCWRTHRALVCTDQKMVEARKPSCLTEIVEHSKRLGGRMNLFVRLDWYADKFRGPLMGEITLFPHMLQPRSFYSSWANRMVQAAWHNPDGGAVLEFGSGKLPDGNRIAHTEKILTNSEPSHASLQDFLPPPSQAPWASDIPLSCTALCEYVAHFDLAPWGVAGGDCVALLVPNGVQLGKLLLATMNRYVALPCDTALPSSLLVTQLQESDARALVVLAGSNEARRANNVEGGIPDLVIIELPQNQFSAFPSRQTQADTPSPTPTLGPDDKVLILRTSGTTGGPKIVSFTLSRLIRAGAGINQSLQLTGDDLGISMLPLFHVGGISCNLIAPLLSGTPMRFYNVFDPKSFFDALAGGQGATWCYLVSTMWEMLLSYASDHPELRKTKPWPRLRVVRSAGSELPHAVALELADFFGDAVRILPTYGMTEAMPIASPPLSYRLERPGSVGPVLPTVSVEIVDPSNLSTVTDGCIGEITVAGPTVLTHDSRETHSALNTFTPRGYYRTGDLGKFSADGSGWLSITGRVKDAVNRGGETIAPAEIEAVLQRYPRWKESGADVQLMIFARAHQQLNEDVALAVAPLSSKVDLAHLNSWACQHLPSSMLPQTLVFLPELPRSDSGKLLRARFAKQMNTQLEPATFGTLQIYTLDHQDCPPSLQEEINRTPSQTTAHGHDPHTTLDTVVDVVRDFVDEGFKIGPDTLLKDAGINSLAAIELSERLSRRFNIQMPTWIISYYPTPRALFTYLSNKQTTVSPEEATATRETDFSRRPSTALEHTAGRPLRILMLHGEGADADLMEMSMQATHWTGHLEHQVEFLFLDAPHPCAPKPDFHPAAVASGYYHKTEYRSWGAIHTDTLEQSICAVISALDEQEPIDGIGGICDGGLVAALVASRREDLQLYLNIASNPLSRLPANIAETAWSIPCTSIHLLSPQDQFLSLQELLGISKHCKKAILLQHDNGHTVPILDDGLKREILSILNGIRPGTVNTLTNIEAEGERASYVHAQPIRTSTEEPPENTQVHFSVCPFDEHAYSDVESHLSSHESIENAVVIPIEDSRAGGQSVYAFIVLDQYADTLPHDLKKFLNEHVPGDRIPEALIPVDTIPLTGDSRIDYPALIGKIPKADRPYAIPRTPLEQELVKIWQKILLMDHAPGIDDDFFELGGYSLLSVILLREIEKHLGRKLPQKVLLKLSTIRQLASHLDVNTDVDAQDLTPLDQTTLAFLNQSGLPVDILHGLLVHTAAWEGKRSGPESLLFGMNTEASGPSLFWCFQGYIEFSQLGKHLGSGQAVYGMRSVHRLMETSQEILESMAKYYTGEILSIQPEGPYLIGGNCKSAKIAFLIALELEKLGKHVALLCLMEQMVPMEYPGRVALFLGDRSMQNPANYFDRPEESWESFYNGPVSVNAIGGDHGNFFKEPDVQVLAGLIRTQIEEVGSAGRSEDKQVTPFSTPLLPAKAHLAKIEAQEHLFVSPDRKRLSINTKITNVSTVTWPAKTEKGITIGYWIYKDDVKPPIYYGLGTTLTENLSPGDSITLPLEIKVPICSGRFRVHIDLLDNHCRWFQHDGSPVARIKMQLHSRYRLFPWLKYTAVLDKYLPSSE